MNIVFVALSDEISVHMLHMKPNISFTFIWVKLPFYSSNQVKI